MAKKMTVSTAPRNLRAMIRRIEERMTLLDTNPAETSKKAGLGSTAVHDLLNGKNKRPAVELIQSIAYALESSVAYLLGETDSADARIQLRSVGLIPIIGIAETGAFRQMADFEQDDPENLSTMEFARHRRFPKVRHFALKIRGDSMNAAKPYPLIEGLVVVCVDFADAGLEIEDNRIYAVRRSLDAGQTYECTIKRAHVFKNRYELHPESTNSTHKPLIIQRGAGRDDQNTTIEVIGLVYGVSFETDI